MSSPQPTFFNYDPLQVVVTFKGNDLHGYQDGTFIEIERTEQLFTSHAGSLGDVARSRILDKRGKITLTLMHVSPTNDVLQAIASADEQSGLGFGAIQVKDLNGNTRCHAANCWVSKYPKIDRGKEAVPVVWVFECADLEVVVGGNIV